MIRHIACEPHRIISGNKHLKCFRHFLSKPGHVIEKNTLCMTAHRIIKPILQPTEKIQVSLVIEDVYEPEFFCLKDKATSFDIGPQKSSL